MAARLLHQRNPSRVMFTIYERLAAEHGLPLVALATLVCLAASFAALTLAHHAHGVSGPLRGVWVSVAAVAGGFGVWTTHFIAMSAYSPGLPAAYDVSVTLLSLVGAIGATALGLSVAVLTSWPYSAAVGGMIVGGGIAVMHYTGMAALEIGGRVAWSPGLVVLSICVGVFLGAISLLVGLRSKSLHLRACGALLLMLATCGLHFTAMGAASIVPDPSASIPASAMPAYGLAAPIGFASILIAIVSLTGLALDLRGRWREKLEIEHLCGLANAAMEGLVVISPEQKIVAANNSFSQMTGRAAEQILGAKFGDFLAHLPADQSDFARFGEAIEADLIGGDGDRVPVELISRSIDFAGKSHWAVAIRDLTNRKQAERQILFLASHDPLTGLGNRRFFCEKLDVEIVASRSFDKKVAVLCLDLDHLKEANDLFGHAWGDAMLQTFAKVVTAKLESNQIMARLGGDEFAIIAPDASRLSVNRLVTNIFAALRAANETANEVMPVSTSIGVAICPDDAIDAKSLLICADMAMYRAKSEERGSCRFFESSMREQSLSRILLEHDLRSAISRGDMHLVYQPQKSIKTNEIIGFEALLRWNHPVRGPISPVDFIPIAEESGAILQIGEWVLSTACREAAQWKRPLTIAVNVSAVQLHQQTFFDRLFDILIRTGLSPARLELEITETALVRDPKRALATLRQLKSLGIRIAMDDFGAGYSSIANLRSFPFDKIKIDRSLVKSVDKNEKTAIVLRAMLGLGRGLEMPMLAEGVETEGEFRFLAEEQCEEIQGYMLSMPAPIEKFREFTDGLANEAHQATGAPAAVADAA